MRTVAAGWRGGHVGTHRTPRKLVPLAVAGVLLCALAVGAACESALAGGHAPKAETLDGVWAGAGQDMTVHACLTSETGTGVLANGRQCPVDSVRVPAAAQSIPTLSPSPLPSPSASASP